MKATELELLACRGNEALAEIFAGFCILSDVQELCHGNTRAIMELNHAKNHILSGMDLLGFLEIKTRSHE